jgi:hypothetical protein
VTLVGHSLGVAIADTAALMLPHSVGDTKCLPFPDFITSFSCVSFESPSAPDTVLQQYGGPAAAARMVSYLASPNAINTLYRHPGRVVHIAVDNLPGYTMSQRLDHISMDGVR